MINYRELFQRYDAARKDPKAQAIATELKRQIITRAMEADELLQRARDKICCYVESDSPVVSDINAHLKRD